MLYFSLSAAHLSPTTILFGAGNLLSLKHFVSEIRVASHRKDRIVSDLILERHVVEINELRWSPEWVASIEDFDIPFSDDDCLDFTKFVFKKVEVGVGGHQSVVWEKGSRMENLSRSCARKIKLTGKLLGIVFLSVIKVSGSCPRKKHNLGEDQGRCEDQLVNWE